MKIMIVDGQGGGVGRSLVEAMRERYPDAELIAVGTNAAATSNMMKGGTAVGATGENAVVYNSARVDYIVGPVVSSWQMPCWERSRPGWRRRLRLQTCLFC